MNQAARNANDGISLAQTAEGSLGEITSNLQRIRELAVQSANSTNSTSDRAALDLEVQQRLAEIDRVSSQSSFNGVKILDGSFGDANFQVGANVGETISVGLSSSMRTAAIGAVTTGVGTAAVAVSPVGASLISATNTGTADSLTYGGVSADAFASGNFTVNGIAINDCANYAGTIAVAQQGADSAYAKAAAINASGGGVVASADNTKTFAAVSGGTAG